MELFDLNLPYEEGDDHMDKLLVEPFVGQCFLSEEEAYMYFEKYAKQHGFSVRKTRFDKTSTGEIKRRDILCHRAGHPPQKVLDPSKNQRNRVSTKCGCRAHMRITLKKSFDIFLEEWHVTEYVGEHNHDLLSNEEVRFLPSYRTMTKEDEEQILLLREGGLNVKQILRIMELQRNVKYGYLPFTSKDVHNLFSRIRSNHMKNDAADLLERCKLAKCENQNFQYDFTRDDEGRLEHIFWSPAHCFEWYQKFGDVVVLDTTYKINAYDMPFAIFVGIDNNGRTILFGCALLRNETLSTFSWLMRVFVHLMKSSPKSILTDQDPWMTKAISQEMPSTRHAFCIWHITSKFSGWFTAILRRQYFNWCSDFYDLYRLDDHEEFEHRWPGVVAKYNLQTNKHVLGLYAIRTSWLPSYLRGSFFGGMSTTGRSEIINAFVKRFTSPNLCLTQLMKQIDLAIEDVTQKQLQVKMLEKYRGSSLRTCSPIEKQAQDILTAYAFKIFQEEFGRATNYSVCQQSVVEYKVKYYKEGTAQEHIVYWDKENGGCSCKHFEFLGILCRHILSVFLHKDIFTIPPAYFPIRWCQTIPESISFSSQEGIPEPISSSSQEGIRDAMEDIGSASFQQDMSKGMEDIGTIEIGCPPKSKTKGRPKKKRQRGGKELNTKQVKTCRFCRIPGHYYTTCPQRRMLEDGSQTQQAERVNDNMVENLNPVFHLKF